MSRSLGLLRVVILFHLYVLVLCCLALAPAWGFAGIQTTVLAGTGKASITPEVESQPTQLGGYGERNGKPATGVHDPTMARALALKKGETLLVLVSCELDMIPSDIREKAIEHFSGRGISNKNLFMAATHSHAAPSGFAMLRANVFQNPKIGIYDEVQTQVVANGVIQAIESALDSLEPCRIGSGSETVPGFSRNRRGEETVDQTLTVLKVTHVDGTPLAALFNYACHPTLLGPETMVISGGWPGAVCRTLEKEIGGTVLFFNGAEGDQGPRVPPLPADAAEIKAWSEQFMRVARFERQFAPHVQRIYESIKAEKDPSLLIIQEEKNLPDRKIPPGFLEIAGTEYGVDQEALAQMLQILFPNSANLMAFQIGELAAIGIPGEPAAILGLQMKEALRNSGAHEFIVVGLANHYIGYILSPDAYSKGGYEATVSFYGQDLGSIMVQYATNLSMRLSNPSISK